MNNNDSILKLIELIAVYEKIYNMVFLKQYYKLTAEEIEKIIEGEVAPGDFGELEATHDELTSWINLSQRVATLSIIAILEQSAKSEFPISLLSICAIKRIEESDLGIPFKFYRGIFDPTIFPNGMSKAQVSDMITEIFKKDFNPAELLHNQANSTLGRILDIIRGKSPESSESSESIKPSDISKEMIEKENCDICPNRGNCSIESMMRTLKAQQAKEDATNDSIEELTPDEKIIASVPFAIKKFPDAKDIN